MSFILDALKKLEEKRRTDSVPDLMTIHTDSGSEQKKRPLMIYLLAAVLLLNAVVLAAWLRPRQEDNNESAVQTAKEKIKDPAPVAPATDKAAVKKDAPQVQKAVKARPVPAAAVTENREVPAAETASLSVNPSPEEIRVLRNKIAEERLSVDTSPSSKPAIEEESVRAADGKVLDISRLPLSVREVLPELIITGHIYSNDPMSRLVNINGSLLREGGTVTRGLKVNEITMSGVVLDYGGMLFQVRAF